MSINITTPFSKRPDLNDAYYEYQVDADNYICSRLFAPLAVDSVKGDIEVVRVDKAIEEVSMNRASNGTYPRIDQYLKTVPYELGEKGAEHLVKFGEQLTIQYNKILGGIRLLKLKRYIAREIDAATVMTGASVTQTTLEGTAWDSTAATPITDLIKLHDEIEARTGFSPNTLVIPAPDISLMRKSEEVKECFPGINVLTLDKLKEELPALCGFDKLLIAKARSNNGAIWTAGTIYGLTTVSEDAPAESPATGRLLYWAEDAAAEGVVEDYLSNEQRGLVIRVRDYQNPLMLNVAGAGQLKVRT